MYWCSVFETFSEYTFFLFYSKAVSQFKKVIYIVISNTNIHSSQKIKLILKEGQDDFLFSVLLFESIKSININLFRLLKIYHKLSRMAIRMKKQTSNRSLQPSIQQGVGLKLLIRNIYSIDLALGLQSRTQQNKQFWNRVITLNGSTKAGKTTSLLYMSGQTLSKRVDQQTGMDQIYWDAQTNQQAQDIGAAHASIGHKSDSQTIYPNIQTTQDASIVDFPGFFQNREHAKLVNHYAFKTVFEKIKAIYFILVIPQQDTWNCAKIEDVIRNFKDRLTPQAQKNIPQHLSILLTKANDQEDKQRLLQRFAELQHQRLEQYSIIKDAVDKGRIFVFPNQEPIQQQGIKLRKQIVDLPFLNLDKQSILDNNYVLDKSEAVQAQTFKEYIRLINEQIFDELSKYSRAISLGLKLIGHRLCFNEDNYSQVKQQLEKLIKGIQIDLAVLGNKKDYSSNISEYRPISQEQLAKKYLKMLDQQVLQKIIRLTKRKQLLQKTVDFFQKLTKKIIKFQKNDSLDIFKKIEDNLKYISIILSMSIPISSKIQNTQMLSQTNTQKSRQFLKKIIDQTFTEDFIEQIRQSNEQMLPQYKYLNDICEDQLAIDSLLVKQVSHPIEDLINFSFKDSAIKYIKKQHHIEPKQQDYKNLSIKQIMKLDKTACKLKLLFNLLFGKDLKIPKIPKSHKQITFSCNQSFQENKKMKSNYIMQKLILEQIAQILDRFSLYEQAISFALAINDFEKITLILHEAFNRRQSLGFDFILELGHSFVHFHKADLAMACFNDLIQRAETHDQCKRAEQIMLMQIFDLPVETEIQVQPNRILSYEPLRKFLLKREISLNQIIRRVSDKEKCYHGRNFKQAIEKFFEQNNKKLFNTKDTNVLN